jgi:hypothetical protein
MMENWKKFLVEGNYDAALRKSDPALPGIFKMWHEEPAGDRRAKSGPARIARDKLAKDMGNARYGRMIKWMRDEPTRPMAGPSDPEGLYINFINFMNGDGR